MESGGLYKIKININMMTKLVKRLEAYTLALLFETGKRNLSSMRL